MILDVDRFPKDKRLKEACRSIMRLSRQLTFIIFNTGCVQEKMGVKPKSHFPDKTPVSFVLLDNSHLTEHGVTYFCKNLRYLCWLHQIEIIRHITLGRQSPYYFSGKLSLKKGTSWIEIVVLDAKDWRFKVAERWTDYSFREAVLISLMSLQFGLIMAKKPLLYCDGSSHFSENELSKMGVLKLIECTVLKWLLLEFRVYHAFQGHNFQSCGRDWNHAILKLYEAVQGKKRNGLRGRLLTK